MKRLILYKGDQDISDDIELRNGKSNPWGWSQSELWHVENVNGAKLETKIGLVDCGEVNLRDSDYRHEIRDE